ncbi:SulA-like leucine-rich domain-containing protein [Ferrimonas sp. YFM]|uniref:SulA-like leucine-rich domain-containing protein n=1 Tax=Ferrimonas sp. YFM TaxID=3028878 RepID=UPI0025739300|nr:SulA-like leucine-rich domain-containing protein [Ferrimonas sp. YFM]BDY03122.1 cell division inhibitor SulA [Ferrimonas sp. YFM]
MKSRQATQYRHPGLWQGSWNHGASLNKLEDGIETLTRLAPELAELSRKERWLVLVNPPAFGWKRILKEAGVAMDRILLVRCQDEVEGQWAVEQALSGRTCSAVLAWLPTIAARDWRRLELASRRADCCGYLFQPQHHPMTPALVSNWIH